MKFQFTMTDGERRALLLFAGKVDIRFYLNGVALDCTGDTPAWVATDGHRLLAIPAVRHDDDDGAHKGRTYIVPRSMLEAVKPEKHAGKTIEHAVTIDTETGDVSVTGKVVATGKLIDGRFPDWRRVMVFAPNGNVSQLNGEYMADCQLAAELLSGIGRARSKPMPLVHHSGQGPVLVELPGTSAHCVVMSLRLEPTEGFRPPAWTGIKLTEPAEMTAERGAA